MSEGFDRRAFLAAGITGVATLLAGCAQTLKSPQAAPTGPSSVKLEPLPTSTVPPTLPALDPNFSKIPLPQGPISGLPTNSNLMAWTVDDGWGEETVMKYAEFARDSGARITFFICTSTSSWKNAAPILQPLVDSGQVQIANHTYSHTRLTDLSDSQLQDDLMQNHALIQEIFGVDARPYYRPPFGVRDARTDAAAAAVGYTMPVMWYGSLSDAGNITPEQVLDFANKWFLPEHIVIGHANYPSVTTVFPQLVQLINDRGLITVNFNDIFVA